jgi:hypothetical protein
MLAQLQGARFIKLKLDACIYCATFSYGDDDELNADTIDVYWSNETLDDNIATRTINRSQHAITVSGENIDTGSFTISGSPVYLTTKMKP